MEREKNTDLNKDIDIKCASCGEPMTAGYIWMRASGTASLHWAAGVEAPKYGWFTARKSEAVLLEVGVLGNQEPIRRAYTCSSCNRITILLDEVVQKKQ